MENRRTRLSAAVLTLTTVWAGLACAQPEQCPLHEIASLDITINSNGEPLVPVTIAGSPRKFVLNFGTALSAISETTANDLSLLRRPMPDGVAAGVEGQAATGFTRAPVVLAGLRADVRFLVFPHMKPIDSPADGILGLDLLEGNDIELDVAHGKLNLFLPDHCPGKVVYWNSSGSYAAIPLTQQKLGNIFANMQLDGKPVVVGFTTSGPSTMGMNTVRRVFGFDETASNMELQGDAKAPRLMYRYPFKTLEADGLAVQNPKIFIFQEKSTVGCDGKEHLAIGDLYMTTTCYGGADVHLGLSVLRRLHLFFAFKEKMLYATAADGP